MKRILSLLLVLLLMVSGLSACSKSPDDEESAAKSEIQNSSQIIDAENKSVAESEVISSVESSVLSLPEDAEVNESLEGSSKETDSDEMCSVSSSVADDKPADLEVLPEAIPLYKQTEFVSDDDADGILLSEYEYTYITVPAEVAERYPAAARTIEEYTGMLKRTVGDERDNMTANAKEARAQDSESFIVYSTSLDVLVRRADSAAFCFLEQYSANHGTDTSSVHYNAINIDTASGEYLKLSDVIENMDMLPKLVLRELERVCFTILPTESDLEAYFHNTPEEDIVWTLDSNGITFYFDQQFFEEFGSVTVTLLFDSNKDIFVQKYVQVPDQYMAELPQDVSYYIDLNGDSEANAISFSAWFDGESGQYGDLGIYLSDNNVYYFEEYASERIYPFYLKTVNGNFVCVICENIEEGNYIATMKVFRLESDSITLEKELENAPVYTKGNTLSIPGNPEAFIALLV